MAIIKLADGIQSLHGKVGDMIYFTSKTGKQCIRPLNQKRDLYLKPYTDSEEEQHNTFKEAAAWAKSVKENPERRRHYEGLYKTSKCRTFHGYLMQKYMRMKKAGRLQELV